MVYAYGRVSHQSGEAEKYGAHGKGFALAMLAEFTLHGLCWVSAAQAFGLTVRRGAWARVTIHRLRHVTPSAFQKHRARIYY